MEILTNALSQGIVPAMIVTIYLMFNKYIDNKKESNQIKITNELIASINEINSLLKYITKNIIDNNEEKCRNAIHSSFNVAAFNLEQFVINTIINNHIDTNRDNIMSTAFHYVVHEFNIIKSELSLYDVNGVIVSQCIKEEWVKSLLDDVTNIIYSPNLSKEERIKAFATKIRIKVQGYAAEIINKVF